MRDRTRPLQLVELIYQAVADPTAWNDFIALLSSELGGAAIQLSLRMPREVPCPDDIYRVWLDEAYHPIFVKHAITDLGWDSIDTNLLRKSFASAAEVLEPSDLVALPLYLEFMKPQGLADEWPLCHMIAMEGPLPLAGVIVYRREGCRELESSDFELLDYLVPHLGRAYDIYVRLREAARESDALTEIIDRIPTGALLIDGRGNVVLKNRSAEQILSLDDGFAVTRGKPCLADARENRMLSEHIHESVHEQEATQGSTTGEVMSVTRPSGRRPFTVMVGPLLAAPPGTRTDEARAIVFVADPEGGQVGAAAVLETLYDLTHAEAELVRLVAEGNSLEQVAKTRGVTMNTVRSQLKQVFSKTATSRQGELVHLVLAGVAPIQQGGDNPKD